MHFKKDAPSRFAGTRDLTRLFLFIYFIYRAGGTRVVRASNLLAANFVCDLGSFLPRHNLKFMSSRIGYARHSCSFVYIRSAPKSSLPPSLSFSLTLAPFRLLPWGSRADHLTFCWDTARRKARFSPRSNLNIKISLPLIRRGWGPRGELQRGRERIPWALIPSHNFSGLFRTMIEISRLPNLQLRHNSMKFREILSNQSRGWATCSPSSHVQLHCFLIESERERERLHVQRRTRKMARTKYRVYRIKKSLGESRGRQVVFLMTKWTATNIWIIESVERECGRWYLAIQLLAIKSGGDTE